MKAKSHQAAGLKIESGEICLAVNGDEGRLIRFDPEDMAFIEGFYALVAALEEKQAALAANRQQPPDIAGQLAAARQLCAFMRAEIDKVFGQGASEAAFGKAENLSMFGQFFEGIIPHVKRARAARVAKYTAPAGPELEG